jgi:hypothetical protein
MAINAPTIKNRVALYGVRRGSRNGDVIFLYQDALQYFPELNGSDSLEAWQQLAGLADSRIAPYDIGPGNLITVRTLFSPREPMRLITYETLIKEMDINFLDTLSLENELEAKG